AQNPGDPKTLQMGWRVFLAAQQPEKAVTTGAEMIKADTALADSAYFIRTASALSSTNPTRAAELVAQGTAKFPTNSTLQVIRANTLSRAGQNAQALVAINAALAANPKVENGYAQKLL